MLLALTFGLSLYAEGIPLEKALWRILPQSLTVAQKLYPSGTVEGQWDTWKEVQNNVGKITDAFQASVAGAVPVLENNITAYIQFSQGSGLSGYRPSLPGLSEALTQAFNTYVISRVMAVSGYVLSRTPNTDVHALQTNGTKLNWNTNCGGGYDANGLCDSFFYDGTDTYGLTDGGHWAHDMNDILNHFMTGTAPMTTGKLLFTGAQSCFHNTGKNGGNAPVMNLNNPLEFSCLSNLRVCNWDLTSLGPFDASCPKGKNGFTPELQRFGAAKCNGGGGRFQPLPVELAVPRVYLGPGIKADRGNIKALKGYNFCNTYDA